MPRRRLDMRRINTIYLVVAAAAAITVMALAWQSSRQTPHQESLRLAFIQLKILRQARDRIEDKLTGELEAKIAQLAQLSAVENRATTPNDVAALNAALGALNVEGAMLQCFDRQGPYHEIAPPGQRLPVLGESDAKELLAWAAASDKPEAAQLELQDLSAGNMVRIVVPIRPEGRPANAAGVLCFWFPSVPLLNQYLQPLQLLSEGYEFVMYSKGGDASANEAPTLLWHSSEPSRRSGALSGEAARFRKALTEKSEILKEGGDDFEIIEMPRWDGGGQRREILALTSKVFGAKKWILGLSTPYSVAVEYSAAQRNSMVLLGLLTLMIILVGVGLLYYQHQRLVVEANEQQNRQLDEMQQHYRELFAENPTAMLVVDGQDQLVDCNYSAERLIGLSRLDAIGTRLVELFEQDSIDPHLQTLNRKGNLHDFEARLVRRSDHTALLVEIWGRKIGENRILMAHDIEQRRDLERQVSRLKRMDSMGSLASTLAHDFNNLLGQIQILVSNLRVEVDERSPLHGDLVAIEEKVDDASQMAANLLALRESVRADEPVEPESVLQDFVTTEKKVLPANIQVLIDAKSPLPNVGITPHAFRRVLGNLTRNAVDAMPYGGTLRIRAFARTIEPHEATEQLRAGDYAVVEVSDTGTGMSPEVLDTIFEPFFTTKSVGKGTGLGLWTVYKIVRGVGGWVIVHSRVGKGTRFSIYLPSQSPKSEILAGMA